MKTNSFTLILLALATLVYAGGGVEKSTERKPIVLRFGAVEGTEHKFYPTAVQFAKEVDSLTNGEVKIDLFWSGQLGNAIELIEAIQIGSIDITVQASSIGRLERTFEVFDLPFLFDNIQSARKVLDSPIGYEMGELFAKKGVKLLGYWELGFRYITSNKPIQKPSDLYGMKIRVPDNKLRIDTFQTLGASTTITSLTELYLALKNGVIDACELPLGTIQGYKLFEVQKFLVLSRHVFTPGYLLISEKAWKNIPDKYQNIMLKASQNATKLVRDLSDKEEGEAVEQLKKGGMTIMEIDINAFQQAVKPIWKKWGESFGDYLKRIIENQ